MKEYAENNIDVPRFNEANGFNWDEKKAKIKTNRGFWIPKIERNIKRDKQNNKLLMDVGWHVIRFWEGDLKKDFDGCLNLVVSYLKENT